MKMKMLGFCFLLIVVLMGCTSESKTLSIKPSTADFEDVYLGDSKDIVLTLKNKYSDDISITNLIIEGTSDITVSGNVTTPFDMLKGAEYSLTITFTPITDGPVEGLLKIRHTGSTKEKEVKLKGNGVPVARISLSETSYDFQKKLTSKSHTHNFEIENIGTALLNVTDMTFTGLGASSYSITSGDAPVDIQPNGKHTFTVTFAPLAVGNYPTELAITHNAVNESVPFNIQIDGEGVLTDPRITLSVGSSWDFGSVAKTIPATLICEIENTGIDPLHIASALLTTNSEFQIDCIEDTNGNTLNCPIQVAVGAKVFLAITFSPTANQPYNDKLSFVHDGTNELSPLEIPLTGTGRDEISKTYVYTGAPEQWTVPQGVSFIIVECYGAEGGPSEYGSVPGKGGLAKAKVPVTPGDTVYIYVGGKGSTQQASPSGGWNGGGGTNSTYSSYFPGTGGGATDIRIGGQALSDRKLVGGGGGGGGHSQMAATGGHAGGLVGDDGKTSSSSYPPGKGGSQVAGGASGGSGAVAGSFGLGGCGKGNYSGGGGGGAGWYGGGGGYISAGGGGSSYYDAVGNSDTSTQKGVRSGDGELKITY